MSPLRELPICIDSASASLRVRGVDKDIGRVRHIRLNDSTGRD